MYYIVYVYTTFCSNFPIKHHGHLRPVSREDTCMIDTEYSCTPMETFTRRFSLNAVSRYSFRVSIVYLDNHVFSYEEVRRNIETNGDIHTVRISRYVYRYRRVKPA